DFVDHDLDIRSKEVSEGILSFDRVSFSYPDLDQQILKDLSFTVKAHEKLAIIGATVSGKTTLFQLIPSLYDATSGNIYIDNKLITHYSLPTLRKSIGYVPQTPLLFTGSIYDNIAWGKDNPSHEEI